MCLALSSGSLYSSEGTGKTINIHKTKNKERHLKIHARRETEYREGLALERVFLIPRLPTWLG